MAKWQSAKRKWQAQHNATQQKNANFHEKEIIKIFVGVAPVPPPLSPRFSPSPFEK